MEENRFQFKNVAQYVATLTANLIVLGHGCAVSWFIPSLPILTSNNTPLTTGPLTNNELSWLGSINNLGAIGGIATFGFIASYMGYKRSMLFLALPSTVFWILIYFGNTYYHILFARFLSGWTGGGVQSIIALYVSEIANDNIRGRLVSISTFIRNAGVLIVCTIGSMVDYRLMPCIFVVVPITYLICFVRLPNTPQFYLCNGKIQNAEDALKYYKGYKGATQLEINAFEEEFERLKSLAMERKTNEKLHISDFLERKAIKGIFIGLMLSFWTQFAGGNTFMNYGILISEKTGASKIAPNTSSILMALAQMLGCLFSSTFVDLFGRKILMIISFVGSALGLGSLSLYLYLSQIGYDLSQISWVPAVSLTFIMFIASTGTGSLSSVCCVENLPTKIRSFGLAMCVFSIYGYSFAFVKMFPILLQQIGLLGCMVFFMIGNILAAISVVFALKETKGVTLDLFQSGESIHSLRSINPLRLYKSLDSS